MILLSWNGRRLGNPTVVHDLFQLVKRKKPTFLFLIETKSSSNKMEFLRNKLGFSGLFVVDSVGRSGGLALLWHDESGLTIKNFSRRHIHTEIQSRRGSWHLTGFYGNPEPTKREQGWNLLKYLKELSLGPWLCFGDFNEITSHFEK